MFLRLAYTVFLGILIATFVGVGIAAFYKAPVYPEYPARLEYGPEIKNGTMPATPSAEYIKEEEAYQKKSQAFQKTNEEYSKNVSLIALVAAVAFVLVSLTLVKSILIIADGLLLGGVLTLVYSIIRGFGANDDIFRFFVVCVSLLVALIIGYIKFVKIPKK